MLKSRILLVDDDPGVRLGVRAYLETCGYDVDESGTCADVRSRMIDDLCRALLDVLATYSESISALFHDAPLRDEWRETFTVFADDLRLAAQRMAA